MVLSPRFLNLILDNSEPGIRSLRCMDLKRLQLFYQTTPPPPPANGERSESAVTASDAGSQKNKQALVAADLGMEGIRLPSPNFTFQACSSHGVENRWSVGCFPLAERMVLCTDQCGRNFLYDADRHDVVIMPDLHKPKLRPISLFVPSDDSSGGGSLFLMERIPRAVERCKVGQHPMYI